MAGADEDEKNEKGSGLVARLKKLHVDQPIAFAVGVIGISAVLLFVGGLVTGEIDTSLLAPEP